MLSRLTDKVQRTLYNFKRTVKSTPSYLPLYQSAVFKSTHCPTQPNSSTISLTANRRPAGTNSCCPPFSPAYASLTQQTPFYPKRFLYTSLAFDPENEVMRIVTLRAGGYLVQEFGVQSLIPWTYRGTC